MRKEGYYWIKSSNDIWSICFFMKEHGFVRNGIKLIPSEYTEIDETPIIRNNHNISSLLYAVIIELIKLIKIQFYNICDNNFKEKIDNIQDKINKLKL